MSSIWEIMRTKALILVSSLPDKLWIGFQPAVSSIANVKRTLHKIIRVSLSLQKQPKAFFIVYFGQSPNEGV